MVSFEVSLVSFEVSNLYFDKIHLHHLWVRISTRCAQCAHFSEWHVCWSGSGLPSYIPLGLPTLETCTVCVLWVYKLSSFLTLKVQTVHYPGTPTHGDDFIKRIGNALVVGFTDETSFKIKFALHLQNIHFSWYQQ